MDLISKQFEIDQLLLTKHLEPLTEKQIESLRDIQKYKYDVVIQFNESEVRSYIIDPMLRILGYDKGTDFSTSHENPLTFLGQKRKSDYQAQLWNENFWLLEAKRPRVDIATFEYSDFSQALEYSVHPNVNAALIVLCDGLKLEIFDRETNVDKPLLHVDIKNLVEEFDKIRRILEPMQVWFFQKRRIVRQIDKVFDKEFVMDRVEEFSDLMKRKLQGKRNIVVENFRKMVNHDNSTQIDHVKSASIAELSELYMMYDFSAQTENVVNARLIELSTPNSFNVMYKLIPDYLRHVNDSFMSQTARYLASLDQTKVNWLPAWLSPGIQNGDDFDSSVKRFIDHCLTYFEGYEPYRIVLLASCAIERVVKINIISSSLIQKLGKEMHALARHTLPEISWSQVTASPEDQLLRLMDSQTSAALMRFMNDCRNPNGEFKLETAKHHLRSYWDLEIKLLSAIPNYWGLLRERSLGEMRVVEWSSISYDRLGHNTLARLQIYPKWKEYLLSERRKLVEDIASTGSGFAKRLLGFDHDVEVKPMSVQDKANRFFMGDVKTLEALTLAYSKQ